MASSFIDPRTYGALVRDVIIPGSVRSRLPALSLRRVRSTPNARAAANLERIPSDASLSSDGGSTVSTESGEGSIALRPRAATAAVALGTNDAAALVPYDKSTTYSPTNGADAMALNMAYAHLHAVHQSRSQPKGRDPRLERAMLVDAAKYSMLALPADLSEAEFASLCNSMPQRPDPQACDGSPSADQSRLRRTIALFTSLYISFALLLLPILALVWSGAVRLEQRFELFRRLTAVIVSLMAKAENLNLKEAIQATSQSPIMGWTVDVGHWAVNGVVGGALDGWHKAARNRRAMAENRANEGVR